MQACSSGISAMISLLLRRLLRSRSITRGRLIENPKFIISLGFGVMRGLLFEPLGYFERCRRTVIERLGHILRSSNSSRIEYAFHLALGVAQE